MYENQKYFWEHIDETKWYVPTEMAVKKPDTVSENTFLEWQRHFKRLWASINEEMQTFLNIEKENGALLQTKWSIFRFNESTFFSFWRCQRISKENVQTWFFFESFFVVFVEMNEIETYPFHFENRCYNEDKANMGKWILLAILSFSIYFPLYIKTEKIISRNQLVTFKCSHVSFFHCHRKSRKKHFLFSVNMISHLCVSLLKKPLLCFTAIWNPSRVCMKSLIGMQTRSWTIWESSKIINHEMQRQHTTKQHSEYSLCSKMKGKKRQSICLCLKPMKSTPHDVYQGFKTIPQKRRISW